MEPLNKVDIFGKFLVENLRDQGIDYAERLLNKSIKAPSLQTIQTALGNFSDTEKETVKEAIINTLDSAIHDFLFALQEQEKIQITVDGESIVELSDGIHGEAYSDDGWYAKYSRYKIEK